MPAVKKKRPIAEGDKVWITGDDPNLVHGAQYEVIEARVGAIGPKYRGVRIYNCYVLGKERRNLLKSKDEIRPFTKRGKADLLRIVVHTVNCRAHDLREKSNALLDHVGVLLKEIADLEE